ncbi:MAG TPA: biotin--[acetyl-CoA-carboxylase] ligase [Syntrophomonadaceae bacterium]|nr:biotin--[acetyl-CoA-carboxylase] ligase [Syntrophomonadaceae bacterium]
MNLYDAVLAALKEKKGNWVSGELLSDSLKVSRTAIWKQIKTLQAEGYLIESSSKKGYSLISSPDFLSRSEVLPELETQVLGQTHYIYYPKVDSTNIRARELASQGYPEGTIVVAETQTNGKGRRGRNWYSPANQGIYLSIILRPQVPLRDISKISLIAALAVAETIEAELNLKPLIKWPNDILINNRKAAGILAEAVTDMDSVEYIVIGIGLNINNQIQDFPQEFQARATSAMAECGAAISRAKVLRGLLKRFEYNYFLFKGNGFSQILEEIKDRSIVIGQEVRLDTVNACLIGQAMDIDNNGFLLVRDQAGTIHTIMSGEITILP